MMKTKTKQFLSVRMAQVEDIPELFRLIDGYNDEVYADKNVVKDNIIDFVYNDNVILCEYNGDIVGGIAGYVFGSLFNSDVTLAVMFFYVKDEYRRYTKDFIKELELILLTTEINRISFGAMANDKGDKLQRFFKMLGYKELETHLYKNL